MDSNSNNEGNLMETIQFGPKCFEKQKQVKNVNETDGDEKNKYFSNLYEPYMCVPSVY